MLSMSGKMLSLIDALHIDANVSAKSGRARFTNQVGAGSSEQCLVGGRLMIRAISAAVTSRIIARALDGRWLIVGGGALAVVARIMLILSLKKAAKSSAVQVEADDTGDACL